MAALPFFGSSSATSAASSSAAAPSAAAGSETLQLFVRAREPKKAVRCVRCAASTTVGDFWKQCVATAYCDGGPPPRGLRLMCAGRTLQPDSTERLDVAGVKHLSTIEVAGRLPSQGFSRIHQLLESLVETLNPAGSTGWGNSPPAEDEAAASPMASREAIMHAIDSEINEHRAEARRRGAPGAGSSPCYCMACTLRPNSALRLCGTLLHSNDVAIINLTHRVVQFMLRARVDCCSPVALFSEASGALMLYADQTHRWPHFQLRCQLSPPLSFALFWIARSAHPSFWLPLSHRWLYDAIVESLTPEGVAVAALLTLRLVRSQICPAPSATPKAWSASDRACARTRRALNGSTGGLTFKMGHVGQPPLAHSLQSCRGNSSVLRVWPMRALLTGHEEQHHSLGGPTKPAPPRCLWERPHQPTPPRSSRLSRTMQKRTLCYGSTRRRSRRCWKWLLDRRRPICF